MSQMRIWADPAQTRRVPYAKTFITPSGGSSPLASRVCDGGGSTAWDELCPTRNTPYTVSVEADGYEPFAQEYANLFEDIDISLTASSSGGSAPAFSRLHLDRNELKNDANELVFLKGADAFCAYEIFLRLGPDPLKPVFDELARYGANCLRWWAMSVNLQQNEFGRPPFDPEKFANYFTAFPDFLSFVKGYRFYSYIGLYPDVQLMHPDLGWQQDFWDLLQPIVEADTSVAAIEFQNEAAAHSFNKLSTGFQHRNPLIPWVGTSYSDADPAYNAGTYPADDLGTGPMGDLHPSRHYPAHILDCCPVNNIYWKSDKGLIIGEPDRWGSSGNTNARQANLSANAARAGAMGIIFHNKRGMRCEVFDTDTEACAKGFFSAFGPI